MKLSDSVKYVKGVGPKMAERLEHLGIRTVEDLISFYPRRYQDWTQITKMEDLVSGEESVIYGRILDVKEIHPRRGLSILNVTMTDGTGAVTLTYFNQPWKKDEFSRGLNVLAYGRAEYGYGKIQMGNAETEAVTPEELPSFQKLVPIYPLTEGIKINRMRQMIQEALDRVEDLDENLPLETVRKEHLMERAEAIRVMHNPENETMRQAARKRMAFEELFFMQAGLLLLKRKREKGASSVKCAPSGKLVRAVLKNFPFELTDGQKLAFRDIEDDMEGLVPMQRLVQGDVGSGKTAVAALALAKIVENGYQGALMVPTEVLAGQHYETFQQFYKGLPICVAYLSGQTKTSERNEILEKLAKGEIDVLIGTHALIEKDVIFAHLGLVITDEQHRFGVEQRAALVRKGEQPHTLVMSATPIPRTLALLVYGDLDVSIIDELPPGRQPVQTVCVDERYRARLNAFIDKLIGEGRQVFVVCPKVEETDDVPSDLKSAEEHAQVLQRTFPQHRVACIHGRMKAKDKDACMAAFAAGETDILVSTTVIEVGVDVPNAALMIIENAERFGLSQLHQLRGRIGRGPFQSYCVLVSDAHTDEARARLKVLCDTADGFQIAEADLRQRGPGDFFGNRQHGLPALHIADLGTNMTAVNDARDAARTVLAADPTLSAPEHAALRAQCARLFAANDGHFN